MVQLQTRKFEVLPGQRSVLQNIDWQQFEAILEEMGESRATKIAYYDKTLEIRMPLAEHEFAKALISHLVVIMLDRLGWEWSSFGSTTFKSSEMLAGIEPDDCFYIQNCQAVIGLKRFDAAIIPPPDLAIEVDLTSKTQMSAYEALKVPEIWRYHKQKLTISIFQDGKYIDSPKSRIFPDLPVVEIISECIAMTATKPMSAIRREFQQKISVVIP
jgi:Uma2 family endonuclease